MKVISSEVTDTGYEVWQDDMQVASAFGKGALNEAMRYAYQYAEDGPVRLVKVTRVEINIQSLIDEATR